MRLEAYQEQGCDAVRRVERVGLKSAPHTPPNFLKKRGGVCWDVLRYFAKISNSPRNSHPIFATSEPDAPKQLQTILCLKW